MPDAPAADIELTSLRLQTVLTEYQALRTETLQKLGHHMQLYSIVVTAVTVMIGWAFTKETYDILLAVPIVSMAFALRYLWEQTVITMLGDYLRLVEREIIPSLIGRRVGPQQEHERLWVGWQHYFHDHFPRLALYKPAIIIILVLVPFLPALVFSASLLASRYFGFPLHLQTRIPLILHAIAFILNFVLGIYLWRRLTAT
jgi:hypothetical protein